MVGGAKENPIWTLAKQFNLTTTLTNQSLSQTFEEQVHLNQRQIRFISKSHLESIDRKWTAAIKAAKRLATQRKEKGLMDVSVRTALELVNWRPGNSVEEL
jgi:hypothetical protein